MDRSFPQHPAGIGVCSPSVVIRLAFEAAPVVYVDAVDEGEERRLADWLEQRPEYAELVSLAFRLEAESTRSAA